MNIALSRLGVLRRPAGLALAVLLSALRAPSGAAALGAAPDGVRERSPKGQPSVT